MQIRHIGFKWSKTIMLSWVAAGMVAGLVAHYWIFPSFTDGLWFVATLPVLLALLFR
jgi:ABC-type uncharacterized transport system permease subunit